MQFNSLTFVVFFAVVVALYYTVSSWKARKAVLVAASYLFYAAWNPFYVVLLGISTIADWLLAQRIAQTSRQGNKRMLLGLSLAVNLGLLGYFKYAGFLLERFVALLDTLGIEYAPPAPDIILPVGISFYTFQTLSYTLDVYRSEMRPKYGLLDFALFVSFFPQLVAGPIVRANYFLPQCNRPTPFSSSAFAWGAVLMVFGLFAKIVLADAILAPVVDAVFAQPTAVGTFEAWLAVFAFSGQIFFDFSGYSTCAIGAALCLGFALPDNFKAPYAAIGFSDFWRRWHISLSTWLRDYLYKSLGSNRRGYLRTFVNLVITMFLGGLWHGASWMFVIWGLVHGVYLVIEHAARSVLGGLVLLRSDLAKLAMGLFTFVVVSVTWVPFRAQDMATATKLMTTMFTPTPATTLVFAEQLPVLTVTIAGLLVWHWMTSTTNLETLFRRWPAWLRVVTITTAVVGIVFGAGEVQHAFIYFQF